MNNPTTVYDDLVLAFKTIAEGAVESDKSILLVVDALVTRLKTLERKVDSILIQMAMQSDFDKRQ